MGNVQMVGTSSAPMYRVRSRSRQSWLLPARVGEPGDARSGRQRRGAVFTGCAHQAGNVRFGCDPATSALDPNCKAHELDNLYVVDTSFSPSMGAVNPALTAMANALRVGDHLIERMH